MADAFLNKFDYAMLFSNDSDMICAVEIATKICGKPVGIYIDKKAYTNKILNNMVSYKKKISALQFSTHQLSEEVITGAGRKITKPPE